MSVPFDAQRGLVIVRAELRGLSGSAVLRLALDTGATSAVLMPRTMHSLDVSVCPSCGGTTIRAVRGGWSGRYQGKRYEVKDLRYFQCLRCGEKVYGPEAMRRIQAASPAFTAS